MDNPKIGIYGDKQPTQTVCGNAAQQPFGVTLGLGGEYYCVRDIFPACDWRAEVKRLRLEVSPPKTNKQKREGV
ncbi:hypothetical protein LCGC14_2783360 [marine sediment metagenome]|uniref:Uncharacterized protein n=1 Tax=marine sediment metagenome TaxID=412755 RepID=A0A0F8YSP7_9ZZZZ